MSEPIADQINPQSWSFKANDKGPESLSMNIWNGKLGLCIFSNKAKVWGKTCSNDLLVLLKKSLVGILQAQPNTRRNISIKDWDEDQKKAVPGSVIVVGKNDKRVIFIEIQFKDRGNPKTITFDLLSTFMLEVGTEPMTDEDRSTLRTEGLIDFITYYYPVASVLTSKKFKRPSGNSSNNSGGDSGFGNSSPAF